MTAFRTRLYAPAAVSRPRRISIVVAVAAAALAAAVPAPAITGGSDLEAISIGTAGIGKTSQLTGDWTLSPDDPAATWAGGEQVTIAIDDSDASACSSGDTLAYSALPSVTDDGSAVISATLESSGLGCGSDTLRLNFTGSGTGTVTISNIRYDVGPGASPGDVTVTATDSVDAIDVSSASNAFLTATIFRANDPAKGSPKDGGVQTVSPFVVAEQTTTGADGDLCFALTGAGNAFDAAGPVPTVSVTGGNDVAAVTDMTPTSFRLTVSPPGPATTSTFTINGVRRTTVAAGHDIVTAYLDDDGTCSTPASGQQVSLPTAVGFVGAITRLAGSDRFVTAQKVFDDGWGCLAPNDNNIDDVAILSRGDLFPDALAAAYLAGQERTGILLTNPKSLPAATVSALRLNGINRVIVIGGPGAISTDVENQLKATPQYQCGGTVQVTPVTNLAVTRIGGVNREDTARRVAEFPGQEAVGTADYDGTALGTGTGDPNGVACDPRRTAIVATSENFPDALAGGAVSYQGMAFFDGTCTEAGPYGKPFPILLTRSTSLHGAAAAGLQNLAIKQVLLLGGTGALTSQVESQIQGLGIATRRFAGNDRSHTAALFATFSIDHLGYDDDEVSLARGDLFPDALAGGPHAGDSAEPNAIILSATAGVLGAETTSWLAGSGDAVYGDVVDGVTVYGGTGAVQPLVIDEVLAALSRSDPP